jgi:hypothetical protein
MNNGEAQPSHRSLRLAIVHGTGDLEAKFKTLTWI